MIWTMAITSTSNWACWRCLWSEGKMATWEIASGGSHIATEQCQKWMIKSPKQWMANTGSWILERNDMLASLTTYNPSTNWVFGNCSIENPLKKVGVSFNFTIFTPLKWYHPASLVPFAIEPARLWPARSDQRSHVRQCDRDLNQHYSPKSKQIMKPFQSDKNPKISNTLVERWKGNLKDGYSTQFPVRAAVKPPKTETQQFGSWSRSIPSMVLWLLPSQRTAHQYMGMVFKMAPIDPQISQL